jgi:hypothetical protein
MPNCQALVRSGLRRGSVCNAACATGWRTCVRHRAQAADFAPEGDATCISDVPPEVCDAVCRHILRFRNRSTSYKALASLRVVSKAFCAHATTSMTEHLLPIADASRIYRRARAHFDRLSPMQRMDVVFGRDCNACGRESRTNKQMTLGMLSRFCDRCSEAETITETEARRTYHVPFRLTRPVLHYSKDCIVVLHRRHLERSLGCSVRNYCLSCKIERLDPASSAVRKEIAELSGVPFDPLLPLDREARLMLSPAYCNLKDPDTRASSVLPTVMGEVWRADVASRFRSVMLQLTDDDLGGGDVVRHFGGRPAALAKATEMCHLSASDVPMPEGALPCPTARAKDIAAERVGPILRAAMERDLGFSNCFSRVVAFALSWVEKTVGSSAAAVKDMKRETRVADWIKRSLHPVAAMLRKLEPFISPVCAVGFDDAWLSDTFEKEIEKAFFVRPDLIYYGAFHSLVVLEFRHHVRAEADAFEALMPTKNMRRKAVLARIAALKELAPFAPLGARVLIVPLMAKAEFEGMGRVQELRVQLARHGEFIAAFPVGADEGAKVAYVMRHYAGRKLRIEAIPTLLNGSANRDGLPSIPSVPDDPGRVDDWFNEEAVPRMRNAFRAGRYSDGLVHCPACRYRGTGITMYHHARGKHAQLIEHLFEGVKSW